MRRLAKARKVPVLRQTMLSLLSESLLASVSPPAVLSLNLCFLFDPSQPYFTPSTASQDTSLGIEDRTTFSNIIETFSPICSKHFVHLLNYETAFFQHFIVNVYPFERKSYEDNFNYCLNNFQYFICEYLNAGKPRIINICFQDSIIFKTHSLHGFQLGDIYYI